MPGYSARSPGFPASHAQSLPGSHQVCTLQHDLTRFHRIDRSGRDQVIAGDLDLVVGREFVVEESQLETIFQ